MRFLHTADWQIGMKASQVGEAGTRVREERIAAARRVVEAARGAEADFILVAGDTFEDNGVDRVLVQRVVDALHQRGFQGGSDAGAAQIDSLSEDLQ
jgi:DNA repair exonuclease SbcCD nuclease subunit